MDFREKVPNLAPTTLDMRLNELHVSQSSDDLLHSEYSSALMTCKLTSKHEEKIKLATGSWVFKLWMPEVDQGPLNNVKGPVSKATGNLPMRNMTCKLKAVALEDASQVLFEGETKASNTKDMFQVEFEIDKPACLELRFKTHAALFSIHFQFSLENKNAVIAPDVNFLFQAFSKISVEDKIKMKNRIVSCNWPAMTCAAEYDNSLAIIEMKRDTVYKKKATDLGMIRPFLLLVSMHPRRRIAWACTLDINLAKYDDFGDSHFEALKIIDANRVGLIARAQHSFRESLNPMKDLISWPIILKRVAKVIYFTHTSQLQHVLPQELDQQVQSTFDTVDVKNRELLHPNSLQLESLFVRLFVNVFNMDASFDAAKRAATMESLKTVVDASSDLSEKRDLLLKHGFTSPAICNFFAVKAYHMESEAKPFADVEQPGMDQYDDRKRAEAFSKHYGVETSQFNQQFQAKLEAKMKDEHDKQARKKALGTAVPVVLASCGISPIAVTAIMLGRVAVKSALPDVPASLSAVISGIVLQRAWLAVADINVEDFETKFEISDLV